VEKASRTQARSSWNRSCGPGRVPEMYLGAVQSNLLGRRGSITDSRAHGAIRIIDASVPLVEMFGYSSQLRSLTAGRGTFTMEPLSYERVPDQGCQGCDPIDWEVLKGGVPCSGFVRTKRPTSWPRPSRSPMTASASIPASTHHGGPGPPRGAG